MNYLARVFLIASFFLITCCSSGRFIVKDHYDKNEFQIPMRDGKKLYTAVYSPKDRSKNYPILLTRTPYGSGPYGQDFRKQIGPSELFARDGYIIVYQDVRGKFMSEGEYINMRPHLPDKTDSTMIDETTDTYDTIDWLIKNIPENNGNAGMWGISYPGFYAAMGLIDAHPALKISSPQAPIADWFIGDDMHHNGAFSLLLTFNFFSTFGQARPEPTTIWPESFKHGTPDGYDFFLRMGPLPEANNKYFHNEIEFWNKIMQHGSYDKFWQARNILPHLNHINPAVLIVGGWFDAEDLYGTLNTYKSIESKNPDNISLLVMGPWPHGGWSRTDGDRLGYVNFGSMTSNFYQEKIELPLFNHYLKGKEKPDLPEAYCFDSGLNRWHEFSHWPPEQAESYTFYLNENNSLSYEFPDINFQFDNFISDPDKPVPFTNNITIHWGREFMLEDQRFAARRPDVLVYETPVLEESLTVAGPVNAVLQVSTTGTDADWVVKIIDVYPDTMSNPDPNPCRIQMGGYQQLVRAEIMRAKFRNSFENPIPVPPDSVIEIKIGLQDIFHTFKPGHKLMVQIQSSWFPLFDRNPQKFVDIYNAKAEDFQKTEHRVYFGKKYPTRIEFGRLNHLNNQ